MRALVTGITGFAGSHLVDYILGEKKDVEIVGIQRWRSRTENIEHFVGKVRMFECDLRDASSVRAWRGSTASSRPPSPAFPTGKG